MRKSLFLSLLLLVLIAFPATGWSETLMMATTTSTDNTGLLDVLAPEFQKDTGIELKWTAVGTGKALKLGENCDVDVLLVHAPAAEKAYVEKGFGIDRREIMFNDFVIIGPESDPAKIKGMKSAADALKAIAAAKANFASRGDNSGTNKKEIALWKEAGLTPEKEAWYLQSGQGMIKTITLATERDAYTLTDRGTYIKYENTKKGNPELKIVVEGDPVLFNQYSVLAVNPKRCPDAKYELATKFSDWMASPKTQKMIGDFQLLGKQLFTPNAKK